MAKQQKPDLLGASSGSIFEALLPNDKERRPVAAGAYGDAGCYVICNDGSVWRTSWSMDRLDGWSECPPVPGTRRDKTYPTRSKR